MIPMEHHFRVFFNFGRPLYFAFLTSIQSESVNWGHLQSWELGDWDRLMSTTGAKRGSLQSVYFRVLSKICIESCFLFSILAYSC